MLARDLPPVVYVAGFSWRKRRLLARFAPQSQQRVLTPATRLPEGATLLVWGAAAPPRALSSSIKLVRVEDGFLRSVGLGAALVAPLSWVFDASGIYFDATGPSDLEQILLSATFDAAELERARTLRERIVAANLTKYGVGRGVWVRPRHTSVVLVVGQVESDASIAKGAKGVTTNAALIAAARAAHPDSYLIYKPHPDVVAGLRARGVGELPAACVCDEIVRDVGIAQLLSQVDHVHVMTSLAGFEALLRGIPVTCHGAPFYAGWGLTQDAAAIARRTRTRSLDELTAAALIGYPSYITRDGAPSSAERALEELKQWRAAHRGWRVALAALQQNLVRGYMKVVAP